MLRRKSNLNKKIISPKYNPQKYNLKLKNKLVNTHQPKGGNNL
jgi:hypothetical protein